MSHALTPLDEAQAFVLAGCLRNKPRILALDEALGCVLAADVVARHEVPPFATSAMDGYALRADDTVVAPATLEVIGSLLAGVAPTMTVGPGQAVRIMTGAPIPPGADGVCMVERTRTEDGDRRVVIEVPVARGTALRHAGEDISAGQTVFAAGTVLGPGHLGVLASVGQNPVEVYPRLLVGVLSTGDELTDDTAALEPGKIRDANRHSLLAMLRADGHDAVDLGIVEDQLEPIRHVLSEAAGRCDAIVTSGGVSVGDVDYVKVVLAELSGGSMRWMQVAIRPAKPLAFGTLAAGGTPVFGLPGNPVSALVSYELFVRPSLRQMGGHLELHRPQVLGVADEELRRRADGLLHLLRVRAWFGQDGRVHVRASGAAQESHLLRAMAESNALALVPDGPGVGAGDAVEVMLLQAGEMGPTPTGVAPGAPVP
jgi:molybdenum cofactor synthesis domain-containing protein